MIELNSLAHKNRPLVITVPRHTLIESKKIKHFHNEVNTPSTVRANQPVYERASSIPLESILFEPKPRAASRILTGSDNNGRTQHNKVSSVNESKQPSLVNSNEILDPKVTRYSSDSSSGCLNKLTPKQLLLLKLTCIFLLIAAVAVIVIFIPIYVLVIRQTFSQSSFTNMTASVCSTTTCIGKETPYHSSMVTALYTFDGNPNDWTGSGIGILFGSVLPGYTNQPYVGLEAISLSSASSQYVQISNVNLAQKSFTIEVWLYITTGSLTSDYGIFGQCDSNNKCICISLRNGRFIVSFDSMNTNTTLTGSSIMLVNTWIHLAVVYDATLYQQRIYVNGIIDIVSNGIVAPYQGSTTGVVTTIGRTISSAYGTTYFNGRIDHFTISAGAARNACQIYNDATLTAYYPFDTTNTLYDYSVNLYNGMAYETNTISQGALGYALTFSSSTSYFQAQCFTMTKGSNSSYSFSIWVNPSASSGGGSIIHFSTLQNGNGNCYDPLVFAVTGELVAQSMQSTTIVNSLLGPILPTNTWTHVGMVISPMNGMRLYINGQLSALTSGAGGVNIFAYTNPAYITLANESPLGPSGSVGCKNGSIPIVPGSFTGGLDEFRLYNRELTSQEICVLANL
ncbi:unnamed protein product [Rotaria socialis]